MSSCAELISALLALVLDCCAGLFCHSYSILHCFLLFFLEIWQPISQVSCHLSEAQPLILVSEPLLSIPSELYEVHSSHHPGHYESVK